MHIRSVFLLHWINVLPYRHLLLILSRSGLLGDQRQRNSDDWLAASVSFGKKLGANLKQSIGFFYGVCGLAALCLQRHARLQALGFFFSFSFKYTPKGPLSIFTNLNAVQRFPINDCASAPVEGDGKTPKATLAYNLKYQHFFPHIKKPHLAASSVALETPLKKPHLLEQPHQPALALTV